MAPDFPSTYLPGLTEKKVARLNAARFCFRFPLFAELVCRKAGCLDWYHVFFTDLAVQQALGTEGEVARTAEMRAAAKAVLLRQDSQEKIKRALRRWP